MDSATSRDGVPGVSSDVSSDSAPDAATSMCEISVVSGTPISVWSTDTQPQSQRFAMLEIAPDRPAVIGRAEGHEVPYLDPAYRATTVMPGTEETVLLHGGEGPDTYVSRGHFMLRAVANGIVLVNGVPRLGGGIRPPKNWTKLIEPQERRLNPGEEYWIESGLAVTIQLPNKSVLHIAAK